MTRVSTRGRPVFGLGWIAAVVLFLVPGFIGPAEAQPNAAPPAAAPRAESEYVIGAGDSLQIFVWHNADLTAHVPVRPDGRISIPLVEDIPSAGKTPTQLARDVEERLKKYVQDPTVTVIVDSFVGLPSQQVRVVGQASQPRALPYRAEMTVLDAMIAVGGLTQYAAGNRAKLTRFVNGQPVTTTIRLQDLLDDADLSANAALAPGDIIMIPQSFF
jgi:polysaccharide export outer membrane protein